MNQINSNLEVDLDVFEPCAFNEWKFTNISQARLNGFQVITY